MNDPTSTSPPIVCDMTDAPDTAAERIREYERLFAAALVDRERTPAGVRFRFRADDGIEDWVRTIATKEKACCAWLNFDIAVEDGEVAWEWPLPDDEIADVFAKDLYELPDTISAGPAAVLEQMSYKGEHVMVRENGASRPATPAELGLS